MSDLHDFYQINDYLSALVPERSEEMRQMETYAEQNNFPIIGPVCGYLCYQIARMVGARAVFEMGSGYGYSTAWFARAVVENGGGRVHHTVWDEKLSQEARVHLEKLGYASFIEYHVAEAIDTLEHTLGPFDLIFNDINKECYPESVPMIRQKLRPGGVLIVDNLLWGGHVFEQNRGDASTEGVREFTRLLTTDPDWISTIIPIRDGMLLAFRC
ncbi:MAG: O-methyltransferase [Anaerolineales bacterium]|nr:O-methyltransferase [Anaerolineae bacterium]PWB56657.1 MAG: O-methyltransferase [Anaerolineales bacterium]